MTSYSKMTTPLPDDNASPSKSVDVLDEDKPVAGQKFVCVSFLSPEKILKQKDIFFFEEFLNKWDFTKGMEKFHQFVSFISFKYKIDLEDIMSDFQEFIQDQHAELVKSGVEDDYKTFIDQHEQHLEDSFNKKYDFQTSTRGLKIRGVYPTQDEAELRCKMLREMDPNHDVFVGPVGLWMPWDPEAYKTGKVEYLEEELNQLMHQKNKNETFAKASFDERVKENKQKAIEDNIRNAENSDLKLTQGIDEDGNLIGVNNMNTQEDFLKDQDTISSADIRTELFEGDNIITGKTDHGVSKLVNDPFSTKKDD